MEKSTQAGGLSGNRAIGKHLPATVLITITLLTALACAGCQQHQPLPEQGTYAQRLYVERCGTCHRPYRPSSMTAAMWEVQVEAMDAKIVQAGQPPLSSEESSTIIAYLKRNAGTQ